MIPLDRRFHIYQAEDGGVGGGVGEDQAANIEGRAEEFEAEEEGATRSGGLRRELSVEDLFAPLTRLDVNKYLPSSSAADDRSNFGHDALSRVSASSHSHQTLSTDPFLDIPTSFAAKSGHAFSVNMATIPEETGSLGLSERAIHASDSEAAASISSKGRSRRSSKHRCATSRSPSGNELLQNSNSDDDQQVLDDRKQRRMLSNRESARRSRLRKQQHLDELQAHVTQLRAQNSQMLSRFNVATQHFAEITEENRKLRSEAMDLSHQLQRLHHIVVANGMKGVRFNSSRNGQLVDGSKQ